MARTGPLQELPLDQFLPHNPNIPHISPFKSSRPNKRTLSPGGANLFSPAKRRILNEEGIFLPEKTTKSSVSTRGRASTPTCFIDILSGPSSPARRLDFGNSKVREETDSLARVTGNMVVLTPSRERPVSLTNKLAPSPEFKSKSTLKPSSTLLDEDDGYFSLKHRPQSSPHPFVVPIVVPREPLPPSDPQSVHYPGFRVYLDTHIMLSSTDTDMEVSPPVEKDADEQKENLSPRRKAHKAVTAPSFGDPKSQLMLMSPEMKKRELEKLSKTKSTSATPRQNPGGDRQITTSPTPRKPAVGLTVAMTASTPRLMRGERKEMRRLLEDEVDGVGDENEGYSDLRGG